MKNTKHFLALLLVTLCLLSCDKDYNTIGTGLVDEGHFDRKEEFDAGIATEQVLFYDDDDSSVDFGVQTDNLAYNTLGYYKHPVYDGVTASVVSQVSLSEYGKDFGDNPVVTKVILSVPYFSTKTETSEAGIGTYELDSIYGEANRIDLKIYRSDYFLNDFDEASESRVYYSNETLPGIEDVLLYEKDDFECSPAEIPDEDSEGEYVGVTPRMFIESNSVTPSLGLKVSDFNWLVDPANEDALSSDSNFKDFYRGVFFKATAATLSEGVLMGLNMSQANIEVFHGKLLFEDDGTTEIDLNNDNIQDIEEVGSIKLLLNGKKVNFFKHESDYPDLDESVYLNGGQGAMVKVDLFSGPDTDGDGDSDVLQRLKEGNVLINEANLEFYVDQTNPMGGESEPDRIFLYDIDNDRVLLDYQFDSTSQTDPNDTELNHLGKLERDDSGYGVKYKIKITEHITDLVKNDSTNVQLGLVVSNNVLSVLSSGVKDSETVSSLPEKILSSSINSHKGTVLYDERAIDEDKRLRLKIYYTEENN